MLTHASAADLPAQPVDQQALADAVTAADGAPTLNGTRRWRWQLGDNQLDLFQENNHGLDTDDTRLAWLDCGTAIHRALISMAADGWHVTVSRLPAGRDPGHLVRFRLHHRIPAPPSAVQHLLTMTERRDEAGPALHVPIDADKIRSLTATAESEGARLQVLRPGEVLDLVTAARRAPDETATENSLLARSQDRTARVAVLYGGQDRRSDWLRAGEALSAVWINATELGLSVTPVHGTAEMAAVRELMHRRLPGRVHPYLLLHFGTLSTESRTH